MCCEKESYRMMNSGNSCVNSLQLKRKTMNASAYTTKGTAFYISRVTIFSWIFLVGNVVSFSSPRLSLLELRTVIWGNDAIGGVKKSQRIYYYRRPQHHQAFFRLHSYVNGGRRLHDYALEVDSDPNVLESCRFTEEQIDHLIAKRLEQKKKRNFPKADEILKALNQNGIYVQDKTRKYRVDGQNHFGRQSRRSNRYIQRGGNYGIEDDDIAVVEDLVEERARCKRKRDYFRSDDLTKVLKEKYGVKVDDKRREWSVIVQQGWTNTTTTMKGKNDDSNDNIEIDESYYVPTPLAPNDHPTHTMSDKDKKIIQERLKDRSEARKKKKYKEADLILDALANKFSIVVDDRTKEWKVIIVDSFDEDIIDDPFAREARLSQRSAFVQKKSDEPNFQRDQDLAPKVVSNNDAYTGDEAFESLSNKEPLELVNSKIATVATQIKTQETLDDIRCLTVHMLKEKLREAGLPVSGKKSELIDRLLAQ